MASLDISVKTSIIFGAVFQGLGKDEQLLNSSVQRRTVCLLSKQSYLYNYSFIYRRNIEEFLMAISREIVKRTPRGTFHTIIDSHNYLEDSEHIFSKSSKMSKEFHKYQVNVWAPMHNCLTYVLVTSKNYQHAPISRLFHYIDQAFCLRYPQIAKVVPKLSKTMEQHYSFPELKEKLEQCQDPRNVDKISEIREDLDQVRKIMIKNIEDILEQGEKIEDLIYKSEDLSFSSQKFLQRSKKLNRCCIIL